MGSPTYLSQEFDKLSRWLVDDIVELVINPDGTIWRECQGEHFMSCVHEGITESSVDDLTNSIASEGDVGLSDDRPVASISVNYKIWLLRAQVVRSPVVRGIPSVSLRFFKPNVEMIAPAYLAGVPVSASAERKQLNKDIVATAETDLTAALRSCVVNKLNVVVAGGTSSGKTTLARWLVSQVDDRERIITIEDVPDLMPRQPNKVMMISDRYSHIYSPDKLLQASLRMRPDRIILSEVTGADAYTFLKAVNTGHGGSITTIHADTAELAIERMAQTALEADAKMTYQDMISYVRRSIDLIIHVGKRDGARGVMQVYIPDHYQSGEI